MTPDLIFNLTITAGLAFAVGLLVMLTLVSAREGRRWGHWAATSGVVAGLATVVGRWLWGVG